MSLSCCEMSILLNFGTDLNVDRFLKTYLFTCIIQSKWSNKVIENG